METWLSDRPKTSGSWALPRDSRRADETDGSDLTRAAQRVAPLCLGRMFAQASGAVESSSARTGGTRDTLLPFLVLVSRDQKVAAWAAACPDAGACPAILPGRFAFAQGRVFLADQNAGRMFVLEVTDGGLTERRWYAGTAGAPVEVCAPDVTTGVANVADVVALP